MKNKAQLDGMPVWFDGKSINEALFCDEFLQTQKIIFTNGAFFTPEGRVTEMCIRDRYRPLHRRWVVRRQL